MITTLKVKVYFIVPNYKYSNPLNSMNIQNKNKNNNISTITGCPKKRPRVPRPVEMINFTKIQVELRFQVFEKVVTNL